MKNDYEVRGDIIAILINSPKFGKMETLISANKLNLVDEYQGTWGARKNSHSKSFFVVGHLARVNGKRETIVLHRVLTSASVGMEIDHINHDTLNNTDANLRELTVSENQQNRIGATSRSSSGIRGVCWHKASKKWSVQLRVNGIKMTFGHYSDIKEAELVAIEARRKHMPYSKEISA